MNHLRMRLALRVEGNFWNAYFAEEKTMDGAILIGSIRMASVQRDPELKDRFQQLMQAVVESALEDGTGRRPDGWLEPQPAPEHEKAGRG